MRHPATQGRSRRGAEGIRLRHLDLGGGLGIRYRDESPPDVGAYMREACRLAAGGYVALSAPNPASPGYAAFRDLLLAEERWLWGYEEPLASYAPWLTTAGATVLRDQDVGREWRHVDPYARQLSTEVQAAIRERCELGIEPGVYTLIVARVPA